MSKRSIMRNGSDSVEFVNSILVEAGNLVYKIIAQSGFQTFEFYGNSEVNVFNSFLQHNFFAPLIRTVTNNSSVWFGTSSAVVSAARELAARAADSAIVAISAGSIPGSSAFVQSLPCGDISLQSSQVNSLKTVNGINHDLAGIRYKALNHSRGRQVDCDAVIFAQSKGSVAVIQHEPSSRLPLRRIMRRGPSILSPYSSVFLQLDCLDSSPAFKLTVHEIPTVEYVGESLSAVMNCYFESVEKYRARQHPYMEKNIQHWTGESAGLMGSNDLRPSLKHLVFQSPDIIDVDASFLYKVTPVLYFSHVKVECSPLRFCSFPIMACARPRKITKSLSCLLVWGVRLQVTQVVCIVHFQGFAASQ
jgi:hypothetical protein